MQILYDASKDLIYIRLDDQPQDVINRRISDEVVLDIGAEDKIVGIEILDASRQINLEKLLPMTFRLASKVGV